MQFVYYKKTIKFAYELRRGDNMIEFSKYVFLTLSTQKELKLLINNHTQ